jgi:hypothetical protein
MSINWVGVFRHTQTFSSDLGERVFLCPLKDAKRDGRNIRRKARRVRLEDYGCHAVRMRR